MTKDAQKEVLPMTARAPDPLPAFQRARRETVARFRVGDRLGAAEVAGDAWTAMENTIDAALDRFGRKRPEPCRYVAALIAIERLAKLQAGTLAAGVYVLHDIAFGESVPAGEEPDGGLEFWMEVAEEVLKRILAFTNAP